VAARSKGPVIAILVVVALLLAALFLFREKIFGGGAPETSGDGTPAASKPASSE